MDINDDTTLDLADLERQLSERTRVVAFPVASNAVGTLTDVRRIAELAHDAGALAWADAVHYGPHGPIDVTDWEVDVLICSPYKFFGPHLGLPSAVRSCSRLASLQGAPRSRHPARAPLRDRHARARAPRRVRGRCEYIESVGWESIKAHERTLGERFLAGLPENVKLYGLPTMEGRVATFAFNVEGVPRGGGDATRRGRLRSLGGRLLRGRGDEAARPRESGAVRAGIVHYNTADEVDGLLAEISKL